MIVLEFLAHFVLEILGDLIIGGIVEAILWPFRKLREGIFLAIAAIDRHFES